MEEKVEHSPKEFSLAFCEILSYQLLMQDSTLQDFFLNGFTESKAIKSHGFNWVLGDCFYDPDLNSVAGKIGKYRSEVSEEVFNEDQKTFMEITHKGGAIVSNFLIDLERQLMAFERKTEIEETTFKNQFESLYGNVGRNINLDLHTRKDEDFIRFIREHNVKCIEVDLEKANPRTDFQPVQEELDKVRAQKLKSIYRSDTESLIAPEDSFLRKEIGMAEEGHGDISAEVFDDIEEIGFSSRERVIKISALSSSDDIREPETRKVLYEKIELISEYIRKRNEGK